jgi:hypothetical protein
VSLLTGNYWVVTNPTAAQSLELDESMLVSFKVENSRAKPMLLGDFTTTSDNLISITSDCEVETKIVCVISLTLKGKNLGPGDFTVNFSSNTENQKIQSSVTGSYEVTTSVLTVLKQFPNNGAAWNDYVSPLSEDNVCDRGRAWSSDYFHTCIHGGERLKVVVGHVSSCTDLTIEESLGAFDWKCVIENDKAVFKTLGLKLEKGLKDLVTSSGWKNNSVTVKKAGQIVGTSQSEPWWNNPIVIPPVNSSGPSIDLTGSGTIYVFDQDRITNGYRIQADKVAVVTLDSSVLRSGGFASNNCLRSDYAGPDDSRCVLSSWGKHHLWIETQVNCQPTAGTTTQYGFTGIFSEVSVFKNSSARGWR